MIYPANQLTGFYTMEPMTFDELESSELGFPSIMVQSLAWGRKIADKKTLRLQGQLI